MFLKNLGKDYKYAQQGIQSLVDAWVDDMSLPPLLTIQALPRTIEKKCRKLLLIL